MSYAKIFSSSIKHVLTPLLIAFLMLAVFNSNNVNSTEKEEKRHQLVIQVSTDDPRTQKIAMNNAVNLQKLYGIDNVDIEIVAYGPGLGMLSSKNEYASRIRSLVAQDITFSACMNTMNNIKKKTGKEVLLTEGVESVTAGVARIMELQEAGYAYIRP